MSDNTDDMNDLVLLAMARDEAVSKVKELEAKLAKAVEALADLADCVDDGCFCSEMQMATAMDNARTTLAELKGQDDE